MTFAIGASAPLAPLAGQALQAAQGLRIQREISLRRSVIATGLVR